MTSIKALSKILMDNPNLPKTQHDEFLEIVVLETERITRLINQVLDIEKIQSNAYEWQNETFNLTALTSRTFKGFIPVLEEKNIDSTINIHEEQIIFMKGDVDRLTQVIVNLLSNAIKFTNTEGGYVGISLTTDNGYAVLKVEDNGNGIPEDKQSLIFDRFTQINDLKQGKPTGSGLGLFITKQIIDHHNGTILVESGADRGTLFIVKLPIL
jgi:signal transduction histidine kinase